MISKTFKTGHIEIPALGMGTLHLRGSVCYQSLNFGLSLGYRLVDTSPSYFNESMISISASRVPRNSLFIISKLSCGFYSPESSKKSLEGSLSCLKTDYIDLYMLEWPFPKKNNFYPHNSESIRRKVWESLISYKKSGLVKHIGVADFKLEHMLGLYEHTKVWPDAVQIEINPLYYDSELIEFCKEKGIHLISHTPLCKGNKLLLENLDIITIAKRNGINPAQVSLRWILSKDITVVVRSASYEHIRNNSMLDFELSPEDLATIDKIEKQTDHNIKYQ